MIKRKKLVVHKKNGKDRAGKGYSRKELSKVGVSVKQALTLGLPIDIRRRSIHESNVKILTQQLKNTASKTKKGLSKKKSGQ